MYDQIKAAFPMKITLDQLQIGDEGIIEHYAGESELQGRLKELGLVRGTKVVVERYAPLGDPIEIRVRGYHLAIRKQDAACITVIECHKIIKGQ